MSERSLKSDVLVTETSKSNPDLKTAFASRAVDYDIPSRTRVLQRLMPPTRRITYQFDNSQFETAPFAADDCAYATAIEEADICEHTVAFEEQNDREAAAECDSLIEQAIREQWTKSGFARFRGLRVDIDSGAVTLRGNVGCFYHKQMAQSLIRNLRGVDTIENEIQVTSSPLE